PPCWRWQCCCRHAGRSICTRPLRTSRAVLAAQVFTAQPLQRRRMPPRLPSLGVFLALDLLLFYVFFDLSLVGMYFLIGRFGHGDALRAALKFFVYTLAGSLAILLSILALALAMDPLSFDMRELIARQPLHGMDLRAALVLLGFGIG